MNSKNQPPETHLAGVQDLLFSLDRHEIAKIVVGSAPADPMALADQIITYVLEKARSTEPDQRALMEERISQLEDDLDEAQQAPWPDWARSILKTLKANGYDPVDTDGTVDLGEAFADYLEGISVSEDGLRKIVSEKNAEISRLRALSPSPQTILVDRFAPITDQQIREIMACGDPSTARIKISRLIYERTKPLAHETEVQRLRRMTERRDEFITGKGLWDQFKEASREAE